MKSLIVKYMSAIAAAVVARMGFAHATSSVNVQPGPPKGQAQYCLVN